MEEPNAGHVYSCSIGLSLKSNCACCWLTKTPVNEVTLFEQLTEDEKYILPLRTKLSHYYIDSICDHHRAFFFNTPAYFMGRRVEKCCDPFMTHGANHRVKGKHT